MTRYKNGQVPRSKLVKRGAHYLPAGTWARLDAMNAEAKRLHGVTFHVTSSKDNPGSGGYRDRAMQQHMKDKHGPGAAAVGFSSHGGTFKFKGTTKYVDAMGVDISNYWAVPLAEFYRLARKHGFIAGYYDGDGKPWEPWHLFDTDPYRAIEPETPEEADMPIRAKSKQTGDWYVIFEHTVTRIPAGKVGSANHLHAVGYTDAAGKPFPVVESKRIQRMLDDVKARATRFYTALGQTAHAKQIAADLDALIAAENDGSLSAEDVRQAVADAIAQAGGAGLSTEQITDAVDEGFRRGMDGLTLTVNA